MRRTRLKPRRETPRRKRPWLFGFEKDAIKVMADGRQVINTNLTSGWREYRERVFQMWMRQNGLCCNCREPLRLDEATFEHENGRGGGKRDDRIHADGKPINGASHGICNMQRGSKRTPIFKGLLREGGSNGNQPAN